MRFWRLAALGILSFSDSGHCQTNIYTPYKNANLWTADTLFVGAGFTRPTAAPVRIWLKAVEAGMYGDLYFMDPKTGNPIFLFGNHSEPGKVIDLSSIVEIPLGVPLTFMYKVVGQEHSSEIRAPKFTGPNQKNSKYFSPTSSDNNQNPDFRYGNRWSVAGRVDGKVLELGFEDYTGADSDMDFDDIVFQIEGLSLATFERSAKRRSYIW